jgi:hypothetical protein
MGTFPAAGNATPPGWRSFTPGRPPVPVAICSWSFDGRRLAGPIGASGGQFRGVGVLDLESGTARQVNNDAT